MKLNYNIVLIGFMGTGKSTISAYLSEQFGMEAIDMDQVISEREGMPISRIFEIHCRLKKMLLFLVVVEPLLGKKTL